MLLMYENLSWPAFIVMLELEVAFGKSHEVLRVLSPVPQWLTGNCSRFHSSTNSVINWVCDSHEWEYL